MSHELTAYLSIFNRFKLNELWPYYQKHVNQIIWIIQLTKTLLYEYSRPSFEFCLLRIVPWIKLSWNSCSVWDKLRWLNWFWQFLRERFLLIQKDSGTHMHGLVVYVKEGLSFAQDLSLENSADSYLCFRLAILHSVSYLFFLYSLPSLCLCTVFDSILSNIDEVLSINPSANGFVFGDFNVHHKD